MYRHSCTEGGFQKPPIDRAWFGCQDCGYIDSAFSYTFNPLDHVLNSERARLTIQNKEFVEKYGREPVDADIVPMISQLDSDPATV